MEVVAVKEGFYGGIRRRVGVRFDVPEGSKSKWFVPVAEYVPAASRREDQSPLTMHQASRRQSTGFVELMRQGKPEPAPEPEAKSKGGRPKKSE